MQHSKFVLALSASLAVNITTVFAQPTDTIRQDELRIAMRSSSYVAKARRLWGAQPMAGRPLAGDLWIVCVVDQPDSMRALKPDDINALHVSTEQALASAQSNTRGELKSLIVQLQNNAGKDHNVMGFTGNAYTSSLLALDDFWPDIAKAMDGHLIAMAPARDVLLVVADEDDDALADLQKAGHHVFQTAPTPLTETVFRWTDKGWTAIAP